MHDTPLTVCTLVSSFWSTVMVDSGGPFPRSPDEEAFIQLMASEAALAEVSIAVGIRQWSPDASCQEEAVVHTSKASNILIQHIKSATAHTAPVIVAVISMAIGERVAQNDLAWDIHIGGLANIIAERRAQGEGDLPSWLCDFLILDSTNAVFDFPLVYHRKVIGAARAYGDQHLCEVADMTTDVIRFRQTIDAHRTAPDLVTRVINLEEDCKNLLSLARTLQSNDNPYIQAVSYATELILYLSCYPSLEANLTLLANGLRDALCRLPVRPCLFLNLTSCQLMLGAVAAGEGSETRAWFVAMLRRAVSTLRSRGWERPLEILERGFAAGVGLVDRFRALWKELDSER